MRDPKDPQKERVYLLEQTELSGHTEGVVPAEQLYSHARQACSLYNVSTPALDLTYLSAKDAGEYDADAPAIRLNNDCGRNFLILAHELAHHIVWCKWRRAQDHGPRFVRVYAELLDLMRLVPLAGMRAACRRHGVQMARRVR